MANASNSGILNNRVAIEQKAGLLPPNDIKPNFPQLVVTKPQNPVVFHVFAANQQQQQAAQSSPAPITTNSAKMKPQNCIPVPNTQRPQIQPQLAPNPGVPVAVRMKPPQNFIITTPQPGQPPFIVPSTAVQGVPVKVKPHNNFYPAPGQNPQQIVVSTAGLPVTMKPQNSAPVPQSVQPPVATYTGIGTPPAAIMPQQQPQQQGKEALFDNMRKCKNFLQTLLKLATNQQHGTVDSVRQLIQQLINGDMEPEAFTERLQKQLHSSPQPYLIPFLRKNLPLLRLYMIQNKTKIEGITTPPLEVMRKHPLPHSQALVHSSLATNANPSQAQPIQQPLNNRVAFTVNGNGMIQLAPNVAAKFGNRNPNMTKQAQAMMNQQQVVGPTHKLTQQQLQQLMQKQMMQLQHRQGSGQPQLSPAPLRGQIPHSTRPMLAPHPANSVRSSLAKSLPSTVQALASASTSKSSSQPASREKRKYDSLRDDDDINDVATMGGVNLSEESKNILSASSSLLSSQMRSCRDESLINSPRFQAYLTAKAQEMGLSECSKDAADIISHATQELLKGLLSKLSMYSEHRLENKRMDPRFEVKQDTKQQLKFLEELDKREQKKQEDTEREALLRAAKSRSKNEDPEQLKLKEKAKAMQQAEQDEIRHREANLTALAAIGKRRKLDDGSSSTSFLGSPLQKGQPITRPRLKRVHLRDMIFVLEQDPRFNKSSTLFKAYLK